jgi:NADH:ubiquinone oxidoreductase subunit 6 (subunit J)
MAMTLLFEGRAGLAKMKGKTTEAELLGETFTEWIIVVFKVAPTRLLVTLILAFLLVFLNSGGG